MCILAMQAKEDDACEEEHEEEYLSEDEIVDPDAVGSGEPTAVEARPEVPTAASHVHPHRALTSALYIYIIYETLQTAKSQIDRKHKPIQGDSVWSATTAATNTPSPSRPADLPDPSPPSEVPAPSDLQTPSPLSKPSAEVPTPTDEKQPCARRTKQLMLDALNEECEMLELLLLKKRKLEASKAASAAGVRGSTYA